MTAASPATHQHDATRERLAFTSITVERAPGIHPGFTIDGLSPDINIVFGPNASGKSTTARAIQALIWPHPSTLRQHHLRAAFTLGEEPWEIEADATRIRRSRDGETAHPPVLAPIDDRMRYTLGLHDLLASENQPMAQAILKESSGGFDLDIVAESLGYNGAIPSRLESARNVEAALARLREAERAQGDTIAQQQRLVTLREEERKAREAAAKVEAIRKALRLAQARREVEAARASLAVFPAGLANARGDEADRIADLDARIRELDARRADLETSRDRAIAVQSDAGFADAPPSQEHLDLLREEREALKKIEDALDAAQRDLRSARAERESHQRRLAADLSDAQIASLDADGIRELADLAHAYEDIRSRRRARDEVESWIGAVHLPDNIDALREGVDALAKRIQNPNREETGALLGRARMAAYLGGLLVIASAIWLANFAAWPWIFLALLGVLVIFFAWRFTMPASVLEAERQEARYRETGLPEPASWTMPAVRERMNALQEDLRVALVEQEKAERWSALEQERIDLDRAYAETEARRNAAIARYGVAPNVQEDSLHLLAENLGRWQAADTAVRALEARLNQLGSERLKREGTLRREIADFGYETPAWDEHLADLGRRLRLHADASEQATRARADLDRAVGPELDRLRESRVSILRGIGMENADLDALRAELGRLDAFREAKQAAAGRERAVREAEDALALTPHLRDEDPAHLQEMLSAADSASARLDPVLREIGEITTRINDAKNRHDVEAALGRRDDAMNALRADREALASSVVGNVLLGSIQEETRDAAMPIVFHRARELFSIITRGRYELEFDEGPPPSFLARDTSTGLLLHLDQLSSGTRVQVLMAIRLAFVENVEVGPKLPVLLDETLGNSDEFRAGAIIDAAIEIARKGRQVFYFTAQGDEVARWQARLDDIPSEERPEATIVDLAEVRRDAGFDRLPRSLPGVVRTRREVPSPEGYDRETYGAAIKAPGIDPWMDGPGGVHLWHLVDDLPALHTLLEQDIQVWGQLAAIARASGVDGIVRLGVPEEVWDRAGARVRLLENAFALWRSGHAQPLTARDIADAGLVDPAALDALATVLDAHDGAAAAFVETLGTMDDAPVSDDTRARLEAWLIGEGYIAQGEELPAADLRASLIRSARDDLRRGHLDAADIDDVLERLPAPAASTASGRPS